MLATSGAAQVLLRGPGRACAWAAAPPGLAAAVLAREAFGASLEDLLRYGACAAERGPVEAALARCAALPDAMQVACVDGVGHGISAGSLPPEAAAALLDRLPPSARGPVADGAARAWTEAAEGELAPTTAALAAAGIEPSTVINGVRVGLQRSRGDDLPEAIATAARWPPSAWPALFEELGWRAGDEDPEAPFAQLEAVPEAARPAFLRGAARGAALRVLQGLRPAEAADALNALIAAMSAQRPLDGRELRWGVAAAIQLSRWSPAERAAVLEGTGLVELARERSDLFGLGVWAGPEDGEVQPQQPTILR